MSIGLTKSTMEDKTDPQKTIDPQLEKIIARNSEKGPFGLQTPVVWLSAMRLTTIHLLALGGLIVAPGAKWATWLLAGIFYWVSCLGVTAGAHRLWTHRSYKATLPLQILLMISNSTAAENDLLEWCRDHRVHHKYSETDADPHNAKRGFFFAHMGWLMMRKHPEVLRKGSALDISDLKRDPVVMFQHRHYFKLVLFFCFFLPAFIPWYFWEEKLWTSFLVVGVLRYVLVLHCTWLVNSAAHMWGNKPYDKTINPSENWFVSFTAGGEGYHNYHHTFPYDYGTSEFGVGFNATTMFLDFMAKLGLVYDRKQASHQAVEGIRRRVGDLSEK